MRNFVVLGIIAIATLAVLVFIFNPQILSDIWLWLIGLMGPIIAVFKNGLDAISNFFKKSEEGASSQTTTAATGSQNGQRITELENEIAQLQVKIKNQNQTDTFNGATVTVLRYFDDGETTLGLLFFSDRFYCYTLEDTFRAVKEKGKTRIPKGTYNLDFYEVETELTKKYRKTRDWFDFHIHIQKVANFTNVYIHSGSDHTHTDGCLLIADSISSSDKKRMIFNSRKTYERFYKEIKKLKAEQRKVRIKIFDENWFKLNHLKNRNV